MLKSATSSWWTALSALVLCAGIWLIIYFIERHESGLLLSAYTVSFAAYIIALYTARSKQEVWWLMMTGLLCRWVLLPAIPNLSDDFYRFIWDGRLWNQGINPFAYLPSQIIRNELPAQLQGINAALYQSLNSPDYFTIYPPVNQFIFALATRIFPESVWGSIIIIRAFILLAESTNIWLLYQLLQKARLPARNTLIYALNPLVILELSGNLHFEALMLCFLLLSLYFLQKQHLTLSAASFALAVCTKLIPLIFLPLYLRRLGLRKSVYFYGITGIVTVLMFYPLLSRELMEGMSKSIGLYFQKFEFNASIYYIIREIGYYSQGYNIIESAGRWLAISTFLFIMIFTWRERNRQLPVAFMWVLLIYLLLATTVHPWYIIPLLAFSSFSSYRYTIAWSGAIFFSYAGYTTEGYQENLAIIFVEYALVLGILGYELFQQHQGNSYKLFR